MSAMKKWIPVVIAVCITAGILGYFIINKNKEYIPTGSSLELNISDTYSIDYNFFSGLQFNQFMKPSAVLSYNNQILITDALMNCVYVFSDKGVFVKSFGSTGNGEGQFLTPTSLTAYDNYYYILDSRNNRIQVFDLDFAFCKEITLGEIPADEPYCDIVVKNENTIYVSTEYGVERYAHVYRVDVEAKVIHAIGRDLVGYLTIRDGIVYFVNTFEFVKERGERVGISGVNNLYTVDANTLELFASLPYKYTPFDLFGASDGFYFVSGAFASIDFFDSAAHYQYTIYKFKDMNEIKKIYYREKDKDFFVVDSEGGIFHLVNSKQDNIESLTSDK